MDEQILALEKLTESILARLNEASYEELASFIEERQKLIDEINESLKVQSPSPDQKSRLSAILQNDSLLIGKIQELQFEAADWLRQRNHAKAQRNVYEMAYTPESYLMDRRK